MSTNELHALAAEARLRAYAPYSTFLVGAVVRIGDQTFTGCNIENASYGATICAERTAVLSAVAASEGKPVIDEILLITDTANPVASPCGMCLQVLSEFMPAKHPVHLANLEGVQSTLPLSAFLPHQFDGSALQ